jgi:hypothetical protein
MLRGTFTHDEYRQLCDALERIGAIYNSMCVVEAAITLASAYLHTCKQKADIEGVVTSILGEKISECTVDVEERHAANSR